MGILTIIACIYLVFLVIETNNKVNELHKRFGNNCGCSKKENDE